jgi:hypothetical protein
MVAFDVLGGVCGGESYVLAVVLVSFVRKVTMHLDRSYLPRVVCACASICEPWLLWCDIKLGLRSSIDSKRIVW